jgi:hypothetical protein
MISSIALWVLISTFGCSKAAADDPFDPAIATCVEWQTVLDDYCQGRGYDKVYILDCDDNRLLTPPLRALDAPSQEITCVND